MVTNLFLFFFQSLSEEKLREEIKKCGEMWDHTLREDDMVSFVLCLQKAVELNSNRL